MSATEKVVFLFDDDNTSRGNDQIIADFESHLLNDFGFQPTEAYWVIFEALRNELGYADYLGALHRYRLCTENDPRPLALSALLADYPFVQHLFSGSIEFLQHFRTWKKTVNLPEAEVVFQPVNMDRPCILAINGDSSTIRFALYVFTPLLRSLIHGKVTRIGMSGTSLAICDAEGNELERRYIDATSYDDAVSVLLECLNEHPSVR